MYYTTLTIYPQNLCKSPDNVIILQIKFLNIEVGCYVEAASFGDLMFFRRLEDLQLVLIQWNLQLIDIHIAVKSEIVGRC